MSLAKQTIHGYELPLFSEQGQQKVRPVIIAASIAFSLLYFLSMQLSKPYIEQDLTSRSFVALSHSDLNITFSGRDGSVEGIVASKQEAQSIVEKVSQVWGVRTVENKLQVLPAVDSKLEENSPARQLIETGQATLNDLQFESSSSVLSSQAKTKLDDLVGIIQSMTAVSFKVSGHTDATGNAQANLDLSLKRAEAVKAYLVEKGLNADQIVTQGYGSTKPVADNRTSEGRQKNRRIEVVQLKPGMTN